MRSLHAVVLGFLAVLSTSSLYGQWNEATSGQMSTGNSVAIGTGTPPDNRSALRLSNPVGETSAPCSTYQPVLHKCLQLAFGTPAAQWWAFRLDANNDLHLIRQYAWGPPTNSPFREGVTFTREGKVAINGGSVPLRIDAINAGGFGAEFVDLTTYGYPNGVALNMTGNSSISVSNLQIGNLTYPVVRSNTSTSPLYLNLWQTTDVVIGGPEASYANMGLRVRGTGMSAFSGALGIG